MTSLRETAFAFVEARPGAMIATWADLVSRESGSADEADVDALARHICGLLREIGAEARVVPFAGAGDMVVATLGAGRAGAPIGLIGHFDTVWPKGTVAERPFTIRDGRAHGPGVLDMKGGLVVLLYAVMALEVAGWRGRPLRIVLAGDEEVGHAASDAAAVFRHELAGCRAAFNCETGSEDDALVVGRKGGGTFVMEVSGVSAHAGIAPEKGRNAIVELAHKIVEIEALGREIDGVGINVGTIRGGTTSNTIPDRAVVEIDVRCVEVAAEAEVRARLEAIAAMTFVDGTRTRLSGGLLFPPMETSPEILELFETVRAAAVDAGLPEPKAVRSGGGSDSANAALAGVPTLCAMGVKGRGNHTPDEYALVASLSERCRLLIAAILAADAHRE